MGGSRRSKMATVGETVPISTHTIDKVTKAKVTLENYYTNLVSQNDERESRSRRLEKTMDEEGLSEEQIRFLNVSCSLVRGRHGLLQSRLDEYLATCPVGLCNMLVVLFLD
ncbi:serine/threonine-protein kinase 38-like protein [Biomphalaria glabrata]